MAMTPESDLEFAVARMFGVGFHGMTIDDDLGWLIERGVSTVVLFKRNIESPHQVADLCAQIKRRAGRPIAIAIDQEGGRVMRLRGQFSDIPAMRDLGRIGDPELARQVGVILGRELRAVNIDLNFAPVMDVDSNPANPVIASRSFGPTPELVTKMGVPLIEGLQSTGVAACAKHFPGHGDTSTDSHIALPRVSHSMERLEKIELPPFRAAVKAGVSSVMTAHIIIDAVDKDTPATMSNIFLSQLLRGKMGFGGVIFTDDLEMKAIAEHFGLEDAIIRGALAGVDVFTICHDHNQQARAIDLMIDAIDRGVVPMSGLEQANRRVDAMLTKYADGPPQSDMSYLGCDEHRELVERIRELAAAEGDGQADPTDYKR